MKLKIFIIQMICLFAFTAQAKHVTVENAQSVAQKYYGQTTGGVSLRSAQASSFTLAYTAQKEAGSINLRSGQTGNEDAYFYVFNTPDNKGFIIISADDRAYPVLGYSFKGAFNYDKAPPNLVEWLTGYQKEMEKGLTANPQMAANPEWEKIADGITLHSAGTTLGTAEWNQRDPYNRQCPMVGGERTVTGCVATAMAIVMKYQADHDFAATGVGSHSYTWNGQTLTANFGVYDWLNMPNTTSGFTNDTQRNAVARLMSDCGIAVEADYGVGGTSASMYNVVKALIQFFGYDQNTEYLGKSSFSDTLWKELIKSEIDANRPVIYRGTGNAGGHAFVCEGYDENDEYAFNWGWGGSYNGFFRLNALDPIPTIGYTFSEGQGMIIDMKKDAGSVADLNQIWLTTSGGGTGMSKNVETVVQNQPFIVTADALENMSYDVFKGMFSVALTDAYSSIKEVISTPKDQSSNPLNPGYYTSGQYSCKVTQTIIPNDRLQMVASTDNGATWKIIPGKTGARTFLSVGVPIIGGTNILLVGKTLQLTAPAVDNVMWSSNDTNVAEVSASGLVTAKAEGTAWITVATEDGNVVAAYEIAVYSPINVPGEYVKFRYLNMYGHNYYIGSQMNYSDLIFYVREGDGDRFYLDKIDDTRYLIKLGDKYVVPVIPAIIPEMDVRNVLKFSVVSATRNGDQLINLETGTVVDLKEPNDYTYTFAAMYNEYGILYYTVNPEIATDVSEYGTERGNFPCWVVDDWDGQIKLSGVTIASVRWYSFFAIEREDAGLLSAPTGNGNPSAGSTEAWLQGGILHVNSSSVENVTVYSLSGSVLYQAKKSAGAATFNVGSLPRGVLIVRGSSGWARKVVKD